MALFGFAVVGALFLSLSQGAHLNFSDFFVGFAYSLARTSAAYIVAFILAMVLALLMSANLWVENMLLPILDVMQSFPSFALFPVLVGALEHFPEVVIVSVLALEMIWPILFAVVGGFKNRREDLEEAATIFGASGWKRLRYFTLPELAPAIVTGSIVGWGEGWEFIIGAELLVSVHRGVGHYLGILGNSHQTALLATGIILLMLLLFVINKILWLPLLHNATKNQTEN